MTWLTLIPNCLMRFRIMGIALTAFHSATEWPDVPLRFFAIPIPDSSRCPQESQALHLGVRGFRLQHVYGKFL